MRKPLQSPKLWIYLSLILLGLLFLSCSAEPEAAPQSQDSRLAAVFRSSMFCHAPCWQNLRPGQSTKADLQDLLDRLQSQETSELQCLTYNDNQENCYWLNLPGGFSVEVRLRAGVIESMRIHPTATIFLPPVSIQDVIAQLGEPDRYQVAILFSIDTPPPFGLDLVYNQGIIVDAVLVNEPWRDALDDSGCSIEINPDWQIDNLTFIEPQSDPAMIDEYPFRLLLDPDQTLVWQGIDQVELIDCK